jgi:glycosyltransferase involved in cell wall biosynthesis
MAYFTDSMADEFRKAIEKALEDSQEMKGNRSESKKREAKERSELDLTRRKKKKLGRRERTKTVPK